MANNTKHNQISMKKFKVGDAIRVTQQGIFKDTIGIITSFSYDKILVGVDCGTSGQWFFDRANLELSATEKTEPITKQVKTKKPIK